MIAKIQSISYTQNALNYCERGGEILFSNECIGNADDIYKQMKFKERLNDRCHKNTFHAKIRIAPQDKGKLSTQNWIDISQSYAKKIGFKNNAFAVYIHEENTDKEHIHIVATRIMENNLAVSDSYTHYKNMDFCREIEKKYRLRQVERKLETFRKNREFISSDKKSIDMKEHIYAAIDISDSVEDVIFHLQNHNIKVKLGRGITFTDENGIKKKGSQIDRKLSLSGIKKMLNYEHQEKEKQKIKTFKKLRF